MIILTSISPWCWYCWLSFFIPFDIILVLVMISEILLEPGHFGVMRLWILLKSCFNSQASYETLLVSEERMLPHYCLVGIEVKVLHSGSTDSVGRTWGSDSPLGLWKHCPSWEGRNTSISRRSQRMFTYIDDINDQRGPTFWNVIALGMFMYNSTLKLDPPHESWRKRSRASSVLEPSPLYKTILPKFIFGDISLVA